MNAVDIEAALTELALQPFDAAEFPFAFLAAFGEKETALKRLRSGNTNASDVPGGVLQRNKIHIAACAAGTVGATLNALRASTATTKAKAKFILATDGQTLEAEELAGGETIACAYPDFPNHFGFFLPLAGISTIKEIKDNPVDVRATGRLNKLYVELLRENPDWARNERRPDMNHFMARLVFCFFAEDTDIFNGEGLFTHTIEQMGERGGANTHEVLSEIFRAMNIKSTERANAQPRLPNWANGFPYVNGGLFSGSTEVPRFTRMARTYLIHAGNLNWKQINPDIFGSMIQAVADDEERGALGMHYTSVPNILKVLNLLFLDDLRATLNEAGDNERKLLNLRRRMARIRVFDPACGSGNFLVIAYKQMREIEAEINRRRGELHLKSEIPLTNFRGIELRDFPAEIGHWNITNLGAILFAKRLADFSSSIARKSIRFVSYGGLSRADVVTHRQDGQKGYAVGFTGLIDFIDGLMPRNEFIGKAFREERPLYPAIAIRELVANALIHQDMTVTGAGPLVEMFGDRLEITNPGQPLVQPERFLDFPPRSRNEALASLMRRMRLCEEQGTGIDKVFVAVELHQLPPPDFRVEGDAVRAVLYAPRRFADMTPQERVRACYQHAALKYVSGQRMSNSTLRERFGIDPQNAAQASGVIRQAVQAELVRPADPEHPRSGYVPYWA